LGPLPTRDNMQTRPWDVLARESTRCGIGGRRIPAYSLVSQCPGLFCSGFYRIGAAPPPPEEHGPDFSPRPQVPESGPPFLQGIVTLLFRLAVIVSARRVSASAVPVVGQRVVYPATERSRVGSLVMTITGVQRNAKFASPTCDHLSAGMQHRCQCLDADASDRLL